VLEEKMKSILLLAAAAFCCLAGAEAQTTSHAPPLVADFGAIPELSDPRLAPDGEHLAAVQVLDGHPAVVIYKTGAAPGTAPIVLDYKKWVVTGVRWVKNNVLLVYVKQSAGPVPREMYTFGRIDMFDADGKNGHELKAYSLADDDLDDPDHFLVMSDHGIALVDADTGNIHARAEEEGMYRNKEFVTDGHGHVVAWVQHGDISKTDTLFVRDGDKFRQLGTFDASGDNNSDIAGLSENGSAIIRLQKNKGGFFAVVSRDMADGTDTELFSVPGFDVDRVLVDEWSDRIIGAAYIEESNHYHYFDPKKQALQTALEKAFLGQSATAVTSDLAGRFAVVLVEGPAKPPIYYLLDRKTNHASAFAAPYSHLEQIPLAEMKPWHYAARDGLDIPAYLTLPPGKPTGNLPLVVMPHGGPYARDALGFDWWAQYLANRGYAVLQPNYRGSSGYGDPFTQAGSRQWGLKMQDDISDGVKKAIADGIADPKRICIVGASYGGYAALAGAAFTPDLYACAVAVAGVSDLPRMLRADNEDYGALSQVMSFQTVRIGSLDDDRKQLDATSPALHAGQVKCPVLLIHGEGDTTVPIVQSEVMERVLKEANKPVTLVRMPKADHYLSTSAARITVLTETVNFLDKYIGH
jgi:dipeptidyl aminopeptidase/acylaminoacyl peptidase